MKSIITTLIFFGISFITQAQNVGIGETSPTAMKLQVKAADSAVLLIQNSTAVGSNIKTGMYYRTGNSYSGGIATIGSGATFRMGLFTFGGSTPSSLIERVSILDGGNVGIGTTNPTAKLEIAGSLKVADGSQAAGRVLTSDGSGNATWATPVTGGGAFTLPYAGTASTVGGAEFSITHTTTFGDAVYFNNTAGGQALTTGSGSNKLNMTNGNTGIGIPNSLSDNPTLGRLVVRGSVGATVAVFDDNATGISLQSNLPSVGFNEYYNAGSKFISTGYAGKLSVATGTGELGWYASSASGVADGAMTINQRMGLSREGSMFLKGIDNGYIFTDRTSTNYNGWNLYANAGKASLFRYTQGGNTITVDSTGALGLQGITTMTAPLTLNNAVGNKIDFYYGSPTSRYGIGLQGSLLQMYADGAGSDIAFGYGSSNAFTENMRVKGNGNVGIGTNNPSSKLDVKTDGYGFTQTGGTVAVKVGSYVDGSGGWLGTNSNHPLHFYTNSSNQQMTLSTNGALGIGITNPTLPLSFANTLEKKISLYHGATGDAGFGVFANELRINSDYSGADITFGYDNLSPAVFTERMRVKGNGNVGIGTNNPVAKMEIRGSTGDGLYVTSASQSLRLTTGSLGALIGSSSNSSTNIISNDFIGATLKPDGSFGIGVITPTYKLDVNGRMRLRHNGVSSGIWFNNSANVESSFIGQYTDNLFGIFGNAWQFAVDKNDGTVYMGSSNLDAENLNSGAGYKLRVFGKIISEEVRVQLKAAWPDYVFENNYKKLSLTELEKFVNENRHLPNIPSAKEIEKDGQHLGEVQVKMLEKIEELTLYVIELKKEIDILKKNKD